MKQEFCTRLFSVPLLVVTIAVLWTAVAPLVAEGCLQCKHKPIRKKIDKYSDDRKIPKGAVNKLDSVLHMIDEVTSPNFCETDKVYRSFPLEMPTILFDIVRQKVDLVAKILEGYYPEKNEGVLKTFVKEILRSGDVVFATRIVWTGNGTIWKPLYYIQIKRASSSSNSDVGTEVEERHNYSLEENRPWLDDESTTRPWLDDEPTTVQSVSETEDKVSEQSDHILGQWTEPYYTCNGRKWILSYTNLLYTTSKGGRSKKVSERLIGALSVDIDVTNMDINQCDSPWKPNNSSITYWQMNAFLGTHKCHNKTSEVSFSFLT
ncbi:probable G-protein coupled receptor CG31760, partial [Limulus polyphemus]|uniref:Probable G-protein coupled receptor CG31760 n=1 Tax=Limulus polyphemus TaxID=6850 RepID=A0ABM1SEZ6_LIMPO